MTSGNPLPHCEGVGLYLVNLWDWFHDGGLCMMLTTRIVMMMMMRMAMVIVYGVCVGGWGGVGNGGALPNCEWGIVASCEFVGLVP